MMVETTQRTGAAANLPIQEFEEGHWIDGEDGESWFITLTHNHKTAKQGPATLLWSAEAYKLGQIYLKLLRPSVCNATSVFPERGLQPILPLQIWWLHD